MANLLHSLGRKRLALAGAGLLAVGGAAGAVAVQTTRPSVTMAPAVPVAIRSLTSEGIVTVKGQVAEVYGGHFILGDPSGRMLVDGGRDGRSMVRPGQTVTVQGSYDDGFIHAAFLVGADGKVTALGPLRGPGGPGEHGPHRGPHGPGGPDGPDGPDGARRDMPPPPPPPAATGAATTASVPAAAITPAAPTATR